MPTTAETENNNLVLTALFKQIDVGRSGTINFKRLAEDIPVNGENAARHRWLRCKNSFTKPPGTPLTAAETKNNTMVLTALIKQIEIGRIDFKRLAEGIPVNGENAARHRWLRVLVSLGIRDKQSRGRNDHMEGDEATSSPAKTKANSKVIRKRLGSSPLKNEVLREDSEVVTPKKGGKRKVEDKDLTDEEQGVRMMQMPARKLLKRSAKKSLKQEKMWSDDDTEEESFIGNREDEESLSGFEDTDHTRVVTKKRDRKMGEGLAGFSGFGTSRTSYCRWNPCKQQLAQGRILQTTTAKKLVGGAKKFGFLLPKKAGTSPKKNSHGRCKEARRRIIKMKSDEEEENDEEEIYYDKEGMDVEIKLEIPSRKLPYRWARATRFVEKTSDAEDEQEEKKDNVQGK
ncbi:hypothetical protein EYC80_000597 [Monilinia laxa]|uniref:Uncharacterized protein n=1 Tax=Monilinia laxa TaxID=61186 RepID=A0A5N6KB72_MONLA|nr:hypothetical protein EYC80_000597 [Monilinia laxa]